MRACGAPSTTTNLQLGMRRAVLAPVIGKGWLASLSPWMIRVGSLILLIAERRSGAISVASTIGSGTLIIIDLIQYRVSGIVSGVKNGASLSAIHFGKSCATALNCASAADGGIPSGLSSVLSRNGVPGAQRTNWEIRAEPWRSRYWTASLAPIEYATNITC